MIIWFCNVFSSNVKTEPPNDTIVLSYDCQKFEKRSSDHWNRHKIADERTERKVGLMRGFSNDASVMPNAVNPESLITKTNS